MTIRPDDAYDSGRLTKAETPDDNAPPAQTPCPCGDYYCSDFMPKNQDRSHCCMYCGPYDCDVCGWTEPPPFATKRGGQQP